MFLHGPDLIFLLVFPVLPVNPVEYVGDWTVSESINIPDVPDGEHDGGALQRRISAVQQTTYAAPPAEHKEPLRS